MISYLQSPSSVHLSPSAASEGHPDFYRSMKQSVIASSATSWTCTPDTLPGELHCRTLAKTLQNYI